MCCVQLLSRLTSFKNISIKPYFWPKDNYNIKLDELKATIKLNKLEAPVKLDELKVLTKLDKLKAPLPTLEVL